MVLGQAMNDRKDGSQSAGECPLLLDDPAQIRLQDELDRTLRSTVFSRRFGFVRCRWHLAAQDRTRLLNALVPAAMNAVGARALTRTDILNFLIRARAYRSYLEIGVDDPEANFDRVMISHKDGVDPAGHCNYVLISDEFFAQNTRTYDLIFIDGLHIAEQVVRDVENSLRCLAEDGAIVLHDCNPRTEAAQEEREWDRRSEWCGTVWKAFAQFRMTRPDLRMCTVEADNGVGVVVRGEQELFPRVGDAQMTWEWLDRNRKELLNLMSWGAFVEKFGGKE